jgi:hypothetical protein
VGILRRNVPVFVLCESAREALVREEVQTALERMAHRLASAERSDRRRDIRGVMARLKAVLLTTARIQEEAT